MHCKFCGKEIYKETVYCNHCGKKQQKESASQTRSSGSFLFVGILVCVVLAVLAYWIFNKPSTNQNRDSGAAGAILELKATKDLSKILKTGDYADLGDIILNLKEVRYMATLSSELGEFPEPERNVFGLKFSVYNKTGDNKYFRRAMGALATVDDPYTRADVYPFADNSYLTQLGEFYDFKSRDMLIMPKETKETWIAIEVDTSLKNPIFLYPPDQSSSKWLISK
jgi:hypothetical protein